eukprot:TRINITY_DN25532_c0_g1_i1.p1 TRINITY_DN25532_c0_g1~~TRINITY_DN25532_c0_g1_i1.p1  ORF type:complete len:294 (+),score=23.63 TRINITY_DN25532_c0_g1_i1:65-946(+)
MCIRDSLCSILAVFLVYIVDGRVKVKLREMNSITVDESFFLRMRSYLEISRADIGELVVGRQGRRHLSFHEGASREILVRKFSAALEHDDLDNSLLIPHEPPKQESLSRNFWELFAFMLLSNLGSVSYYYNAPELINEVWLDSSDPIQAQEIFNETNAINKFLVVIASPIISTICSRYNLTQACGHIGNLLYMTSVISFFFLYPITPTMIIFQISQMILSAHIWLKLVAVVPEERMGIATGLLYINTNLLNAVGPYLGYYLSQVTGTFGKAFLLTSIINLGCFVLNSSIPHKD